MLIVTNNKLVVRNYSAYPILFVEGGIYNVLEKVKKAIVDQKKTLFTHPLSSSLKPNETVYKTIILSSTSGQYVDLGSLELIENAINVCDKFKKNSSTPVWPGKILDDFALIDYDLVNNIIPKIQYKN